MPVPQRIQLSRAKGFDLQAASLNLNGLPAVNCARPGRWGNPFVVGRWYRRYPWGIQTANGKRYHAESLWQESQEFTQIVDNRMAVDWFRWYLEVNPSLKQLAVSLAGKNLACWCGPGDSCHCDVLLEIANK